jgi:hypothetical protein
MSFGRNPHVAKAEAAEQKARCAKDAEAGKLAWREAARQWERAADREKDDKRKQEHAQKAEAARAEADGTELADDGDTSATAEAAKPKAPSLLN